MEARTASALAVFAISLAPLPALLQSAEAGRGGPLEITGTKELEGLALAGEDTCIVAGANLTIYGPLSLSGNARLFIKDSMVTVAPGELCPNASAVSILGNSTLSVQNSTLRFRAPSGPESVPYLISDDLSSASIVDSTLVGESGSVTPEAMELLKPAGCYMLTGNSRWVVKRSHLHGELNFSGPGGERTSWWYWCTLQSRAEMVLEDVHGSLNDPMNSLLKPISGRLSASNCTLDAQVLCEVVSEVLLDNCTINSEAGVSLRDEASATLVNCRINGRIETGVPSITTAVGTMRTALEMRGCYLSGPFYGMTNATTRAVGSSFGSISMADRSAILLSDSIVSGTLNLGDSSSCTIEESDFANPVLCRESAAVALVNTFALAPTVVFDCSNASLSMENSTIKKLELCTGELTARLERGYVDYACLWENTSLLATLLNSSMTNLSSGRCRVQLVVHNSRIPPTMDPGTAYEVIGLYMVTAEVNGAPAEAEVVALESNVVVARALCEGGACALRLPRTLAGAPLGNYTIRATLLGLSSSVNLESETLAFRWSDREGPEIPLVETLEAPELVVNREVPVRARAEDRGVGLVRGVVLHYSIAGGAWRSSRMVEVGGYYMADLPPARVGSKVEYYVASEDALGNISRIPTRCFVMGQAYISALHIAAAILIFSACLVVARHLVRRKRLRRYLSGGE